MSDHDDRQVPDGFNDPSYAFSNAYRSAVRPDFKTGYTEGTLPDAHDGVSTAVMRAVWRCYADHANYQDGANAWPSYNLISQLTGCSRRQVQRAVTALTDLGWLKKTREATKTSSACYTVSLRGIANTSPHATLSPDNTSPHDNMTIDEVPPCHLTTRHEVTTRHLGIANTSPGYSQGGTLPNQEPNQEPVVDAHEGATSTNTPQQVEEDKEQPLVEQPKIDPAALDGIITDLFERYNRPLVSGLSEGLRQRLRTSGLTNDQIPVYIEDRLMEFALTDLADRQVFSYIRDDSAKWLTKQKEEEDGVVWLEMTWGRHKVVPETEEQKRQRLEGYAQEKAETERILARRAAMTPEELRAEDARIRLEAMRLFDFDAPRHRAQDDAQDDTAQDQDRSEAASWT